MPAYYQAGGTPFCLECHYCLTGLPVRGTCPECGVWYSLRSAEIPPGLGRLLRILRHWLRGLMPSWRTIAILLLVLGNAVILIGLAAYAWRTLRQAMGLHSSGDRLFFAPWIEPVETDLHSVAALAAFKSELRLAAELRVQEVRLAEAEVLVIENGRMLHGRRELPSHSRRRLRRFWITAPTS